MNRFAYEASRYAFWLVAKPLFFYSYSGREHVPATGPVLVVSNHASFLDPPLVGMGLARPCRFVARSSLRGISLVGRWMDWVGVRFISRDAPSTRALESVIQLLAEGEQVVVYPEGTRTRTGELQPFKRGTLLLVKKSGATVVPCGVRGSFLALPPGRRLPRLFQRCTVAFGAPMTAEQVLADGGLETLRQRVAALSGQALAASDAETSPHSGRSGLERRSSNGGAGSSAESAGTEVTGVDPCAEAPGRAREVQREA